MRLHSPAFNQFFQAGFTLLEMVLVLFLVGLMASATLMLTEGVEDQAKYDETKRRMELIRKAVVGDPSRTVNGSPEISGFVADMGRLPGCIRELLEAFDCADPENNLDAWTTSVNTGIAHGWRGPYIQVLPERSGSLRFRDGYANSDTLDTINSGWSYGVSGAEISLASQGFDTTDNADDVSASQLVVSSDWQLQLPDTVNVSFINQSASDLPASPQNLVLLMYLDDLTSPIGISDILPLAASEAIAADSTAKDFTLPSSQTISIGKRGYVVACDKWDHDSNIATPDEYTSFLGSSCSTDALAASHIQSLMVFPRQNIVLDWVIQ